LACDQIVKDKGFEKLSHQVDDVLRDMEDVKWRLESLEGEEQNDFTTAKCAVRCFQDAKGRQSVPSWF